MVASTITKVYSAMIVPTCGDASSGFASLSAALGHVVCTGPARTQIALLPLSFSDVIARLRSALAERTDRSVATCGTYALLIHLVVRDAVLYLRVVRRLKDPVGVNPFRGSSMRFGWCVLGRLRCPLDRVTASSWWCS